MTVAELAVMARPFGPFAREKARQIAAKNILMFELVVDNGGIADWVVQLWDVADVGDISGTPSAVTDGFPAYENTVVGGSFLPYGWDGGYQFKRGLYVRAVTALGGSTAISGNDAKFSGRAINPFPIST